MIIKENDIETALAIVENDEAIRVKWLDNFHDNMKDYVLYLDQEVLKLLEESERDILLFIHSVIYHIISNKDSEIELDLYEFFDQEEKNWGIYESEIKEKFNKRLDIFYELYDEEEGLAFIEDTLTEDEENEFEISAVGRDIIWNVSVAFLIQLTKQIR